MNSLTNINNRKPFHAVALSVTMLIVLMASPAGAQNKADPTSHSGHGMAADKRLIKNPPKLPDGCSSSLQTSTNPVTGQTTTSCRGRDGNMRDVPDGGTPPRGGRGG